MTKLQKVNEFTGKLEDVYPNLIIVGGKNIAVPVDKQHLVKNMDAKVGDTIWIKYDERGYLLDAQLKEKGKPVEKKPGAVTILPETRQKTPAEESRMPTRDELPVMVYDYNTYWKAKTLMDIQAHEEIRLQVAWKNWQECVNSAIESYKGIDFPEGTDHFKTIDEITVHFHDFIKGKIETGGEQK